MYQARLCVFNRHTMTVHGLVASLPSGPQAVLILSTDPSKGTGSRTDHWSLELRELTGETSEPQGANELPLLD